MTSIESQWRDIPEPQRTLQFKVNNDSGNGVIATPNVLSGTNWTFVAVTYDSTLGSNQVKIYAGNNSSALGTPVTTGNLQKFRSTLGSFIIFPVRQSWSSSRRYPVIMSQQPAQTGLAFDFAKGGRARARRRQRCDANGVIP